MNPKIHMKIFVTDENSGQKICNCGCGYVVEEKIPDQSSFQMTEDPVSGKKEGRTNFSNMALHDNNLTTVIGRTNYDFAKHKINSKNQQLFYNLRREQSRARVNKDERRLSSLLQRINLIASNLSLSRFAKEEACYFARKIESVYDGNSTDYLAKMLLFIACKQETSPKNFNLFFKTRGKKSQIFKKIIEIQEILKLENNPIANQTEKYIEQCCNELKLKPAIRKLAFKFSELCGKDALWTNRSPKTRAATSVYFASKTYVSITGKTKFAVSSFDISESLQVSQSVINLILRDMNDLIFRNKDCFKLNQEDLN